MEGVFGPESLAELQSFLESRDKRQLRKSLGKMFLRHCLYANVEQWNRAVRLCEALTIVGWGDLEPVEATRGVDWNGYPETTFFNKFGQPRFVSAVWAKRKSGVTMQQGHARYHSSPDVPAKPSRGDDYPVSECVQDVRLQTQRNWIPKNPVLVTRTITNCYRQSAPLAADVEGRLMPELDKHMAPERYGAAVNRIIIDYSLSYADPGDVTNYIILDEDVRLSPAQLHGRLRNMYSAKEIEKHGYYLRKRYDYGAFKADRGVMKVGIHFPKEFSQQGPKAQKHEFARHLTEALEGAVSRLRAKQLAYDFDGMNRDFQRILRAWTP